MQLLWRILLSHVALPSAGSPDTVSVELDSVLSRELLQGLGQIIQTFMCLYSESYNTYMLLIILVC